MTSDIATTAVDAVPTATGTASTKRVVKVMKVAERQKKANKTVFRHASLLRLLRMIADEVGLVSAPPKSAIHWSRESITLIGTALEKRIRDILIAANNVVKFGEKQTVNKKAIWFAMNISKDSLGSLETDCASENVKACIRRVISNAAIDRIVDQVGIQRVSRDSVNGALRIISANFLYNVVTDCKFINTMKPRSTVSTNLAALSIGSNIAGFRKIKKPKDPVPIMVIPASAIIDPATVAAVQAQAPAPIVEPVVAPVEVVPVAVPEAAPVPMETDVVATN